MAEIIEGMAKLNAQLKKLGNLSGKAILAGALKLQELSQKNCPVDTGFLRSSAESTSISDTEAEMAFTAGYAWYVEEDQPYVRPAIDEKSNEILEAIKNQIQQEQKDIIKK